MKRFLLCVFAFVTLTVSAHAREEVFDTIYFEEDGCLYGVRIYNDFTYYLYPMGDHKFKWIAMDDTLYVWRIDEENDKMYFLIVIPDFGVYEDGKSVWCKCVPVSRKEYLDAYARFERKRG